jgi:hypothetical protein
MRDGICLATGTNSYHNVGAHIIPISRRDVSLDRLFSTKSICYEQNRIDSAANRAPQCFILYLALQDGAWVGDGVFVICGQYGDFTVA